MKFDRIDLAAAAGAILAHTLRLPAAVLKKGRKLGRDDVAAIAAAGHTSVIAAILEADDVGEDDAAAQVGRAVAGEHVHAAAAATGRSNLHAGAAGVCVVDRERVDALNALDESVTLATLAPFAPVAAGEMVATVKIIPFAARRSVVAGWCATAPVLRVAPYVAHRAGLVLTRFAETPAVLLDRPAQAMRARLAAAGSVLAEELRCDHDETAVAEAIARLLAAGRAPILVLGASAIVDRHDVIPAALERAGGVVDHLGMPVDPGNLLMLGHHGATPVIGVPGCARSSRPSGFDWVLARVLARIPVGRRDIVAMGVGGLLKDVPERPQPRVAPTEARGRRVAAVVLAAGLSRRMGENKLLALVEGKPMVARVVDAVLAAPLAEVVVVVGHQADAVRAALAGRAVRFVVAADHAEGLAASLRAGVAALDRLAVDGALVCLGDMPWVNERHIAALTGAFDPAGGRAVCVPYHGGKRGNPVLWATRYFAELVALAGDMGARELLERHADAVWRVDVDDAGVLLDVDTRAALEIVQCAALDTKSTRPK